MRFLSVTATLAVAAASAAAQLQPPLEATLRRGAFEALFYVDQPAYVAVFEVIPGQGVQQIFPRSATQASKPVEPGEYLLSRPFRSQIDHYGWNAYRPYAHPMYMLDNRGRIISYYYATGWSGYEAGWGAAGLEPTRTLLLVASRAPLRLVSSPDAARQWLQHVVGFRAISSSVVAPQSMLTDIVDAVIPTGTSVDDIVVDVLEVHDFDRGSSRWMAQSITFACPGGFYTIPAQFFFASGMFYCPISQPYADSPPPTTGPVPVDTVTRESLQKPARKVPPKYDVEEGAVQLRGGIRTTTPVMTPTPAEEGYRPYRRGDGTAEEDFRPYGRGVGTTEATRATLTLGRPIIPEGVQPARLLPSTGAWVPPISGAAPSDYGYGAGRFTPSGSSGGYGTTAGGSTTRMGETPSRSPASGASTSSAPPTSTTSSAPSQTASQAQAERSAASRAEVSATRAAGGKPNPDP